jgi:NAD+ kinase
MEIHRIYVVANTTKEGAARALAVLKAWGHLKGIEVVAEGGRPSAQEGEGALVVALGGDGTVLRAAAAFADRGLPILGANLGSLGFLTQVGAASLTTALEGVLRGQFEIEERMRLSFSMTGGTRGTALNDLVIARPAEEGFCEVELSWRDGTVATYPGDGIILSTATGSTAYALSAGGPVVVPSAECILATPLAAHKLGLRPVVFPAEEVLHLRTRTPADAYADGDRVASLPERAEVTVGRAPLPTRLVRMHEAPSFFAVLENKLNWGDDRRRKADR